MPVFDPVMVRLASLYDLLPRDVFLVARHNELKELKFLLAVKLRTQYAAGNHLDRLLVVCLRAGRKTHVRAALKPVHHAGLGVFNKMVVTSQRLVHRALVHDELHVLDATLKVGVEVSRQCRIRDLVLLLGRFAILLMGRVPEYATRSKKPLNEVDPVRHVICVLRALQED